ncbi:hypothetical protein SprV_0200675400 [Sparganum proliferum]
MRRTPPHLNLHLLPPSNAGDGDLDAPSVVTLTPTGLCLRPEVSTAGRAGDKHDPGCRRMDQPSPRHLQDGGPPTATQEISSNELAQRLANLPIAVTDEDASVENRWCQMKDTVRSIALDVRGRVRRQHQDCASFSSILTDAYRDERPYIRIAYRTDRHLLNSRRIQAPVRLSTAIIRELLFAGDCAFNTTSEDNMQRSMDLFASGCAHFGLTINTDKTVIINSHWSLNTVSLASTSTAPK